ncbi:MAG: hypothetical protein IPJ85_12535 [Flavobacteriales bacterium]|nr:hypothetical protein [Flavobacteriales bacterium]
MIACSNSTGPGGIESITTDLLVPGATYYVRVYDVDGASPQPGTFGICVYAPNFMGVDDATAVEGALITPNGIPGNYSVRSPFAAAATCEMRALDAMGRTVHFEMARLTPTAPHPLDLSNLVPGTYVLLMQQSGEMRTQRFIHL